MFRSSGRIVEALLEDFTVMTGGGILTAVAQNTGTVTAEYTVRSYAYSMFYDNNNYYFHHKNVYNNYTG